MDDEDQLGWTALHHAARGGSAAAVSVALTKAANLLFTTANRLATIQRAASIAGVTLDIAYDDFKDIYMYAYEQGLKGCTTFRFNPEAFQGVLVKEQDLKNTTYTFTLDDGSTVELKGDEEIEYDGEVHTAANLFDALKEGYYGKF